MSKKFKIGFSILAIVIAIVSAYLCFSGMVYENGANKIVDNSFKIKQYNIDIQVNENNTLDIEETINVKYIKNGKHGIYRYVPLQYIDEVKDGNRTKRIVQNISAYNINYQSTVPCAVSKNVEKLMFKFGSEHSTYNAGDEDTYKVTYSLNLGTDLIKSYDRLYFNIIGVDWKCTIENVTFNLVMPKPFDTNQLVMYMGDQGSTNQYTGFSVSGNTISGTVAQLDPFNGLTINLKLNKGYFTNVKAVRSDFSILTLVIMFITAIVIGVCYALRKKTKKLVKTVEFYPPNGYDPIGVAGIVKGAIAPNDFLSLIVYFASKKYLEIKTYGKDVIAIKKSEGTNLPYRQGQIFRALFFKSDTVLLAGNGNTYRKEVVNIDKNKRAEGFARILKISLPESFGKTLMSESRKQSKAYKYSQQNRTLSTVCFVVTLVSLAFYISGSIFSFINGILTFCAILNTIMLAFLVYNFKNKLLASTKVYKVLYLITVGIVTFGLYSVLANYINYSFSYGFINYISIILPFVLILTQCMREYSDEISEDVGKILGFKNFIIKCEKPKIEKLVKENPNYFFDVLPYAYVLGVSKAFISKFEKLGIVPENEGRIYLDFYTLDRSLSSSVSRSISSSGGGSSGSFDGGGGGGGGSSGGGSGGGGGGSW